MPRLLALELQLEAFFTAGHWLRLFPLAPFAFVALALLIVRSGVRDGR